MKKTPQEISNSHPQSLDRQFWLADRDTSIKEIHEFINLEAFKDHGNHARTVWELSKIALEIKISNEATRSAGEVTGQIDRLCHQVDALRQISEEQKKLAINLEGQTSKLIGLTRAIVVLSVVLAAVAVVQTIVMVKEASQTHAQNDRAVWNNPHASTNK